MASYGPGHPKSCPLFALTKKDELKNKLGEVYLKDYNAWFEDFRHPLSRPMMRQYELDNPELVGKRRLTTYEIDDAEKDLENLSQWFEYSYDQFSSYGNSHFNFPKVCFEEFPSVGKWIKKTFAQFKVAMPACLVEAASAFNEIRASTGGAGPASVKARASVGGAGPAPAGVPRPAGGAGPAPAKARASAGGVGPAPAGARPPAGGADLPFQRRKRINLDDETCMSSDIAILQWDVTVFLLVHRNPDNNEPVEIICYYAFKRGIDANQKIAEDIKEDPDVVTFEDFAKFKNLPSYGTMFDRMMGGEFFAINKFIQNYQKSVESPKAAYVNHEVSIVSLDTRVKYAGPAFPTFVMDSRIGFKLFEQFCNLEEIRLFIAHRDQQRKIETDYAKVRAYIDSCPKINEQNIEEFKQMRELFFDLEDKKHWKGNLAEDKELVENFCNDSVRHFPYEMTDATISMIVEEMNQWLDGFEPDEEEGGLHFDPREVFAKRAEFISIGKLFKNFSEAYEVERKFGQGMTFRLKFAHQLPGIWAYFLPDYEVYSKARQFVNGMKREKKCLSDKVTELEQENRDLKAQLAKLVGEAKPDQGQPPDQGRETESDGDDLVKSMVSKVKAKAAARQGIQSPSESPPQSPTHKRARFEETLSRGKSQRNRTRPDRLGKGMSQPASKYGSLAGTPAATPGLRSPNVPRTRASSPNLGEDNDDN